MRHGLGGSRASILLAMALVGILAFWLLARHVVLDKLRVAAERDMRTIVELILIDLENDTRTGGFDAIMAISGPQTRLGEVIQRVAADHARQIYFFDLAGRIWFVTSDGGPADSTRDRPRIVDAAIGTGLAGKTDMEGAMFESYVSGNGDPAIGIWRWSRELQIGIVVERPHGRFMQPLRWIDGCFALVAIAVVLGFASNGQRGRNLLHRLARRGRADICGPYAVGRLLGEGAMSNVYLAEHLHLRRRVALKRLKIHIQRDEMVSRFDREARLASQLSHPNIIAVLDHGWDFSHGFFYAMEYVRGIALDRWVEQHGPVPPARVVKMLIQICSAVGYMHDRGMLHRDIKPGNVLAYAAHNDADLVKLLDFGLIKDIEHEETRDLTVGVRLLGTPAFMAPERFQNPGLVDPRTDIYGIGCIGYFLLTGRKPFESARISDLVQQQIHITPPRSSEYSVFPIPADLDALLGEALSKSMEERPATAAEFESRLQAIGQEIRWDRQQALLWWSSVLPEEGANRLPSPVPCLSGSAAK